VKKIGHVKTGPLGRKDPYSIYRGVKKRGSKKDHGALRGGDKTAPKVSSGRQRGIKETRAAWWILGEPLPSDAFGGKEEEVHLSGCHGVEAFN